MGETAWRARSDGETLRQAPVAGGTHGETIAAEPAFDFQSDEYRSLFENSSATAFQHPLWLTELYATLAPARDAEKLVIAVRAEGRLVAVLPLIRRQKSGVTLVESTDLGVSDYAAPVVASGWTPGPDIRRGLSAILPPHDLLRIRPIREDDVNQWLRLIDGAVVRLDFSAHAAELAGKFAEWRARSLEPTAAKQLDRKKKRFWKMPEASLRLLGRPEEIEAAIIAMQRLREGRFDGDMIQHDLVRVFYSAVAAKGVGDFARTYTLELGDESIGFVFGLTWNGRFHYLLIGCDYDMHGRHSPGLLMYDGIIEDWMRDGGTVFDFTIGDEPFKKDFGTTPTPMFGLSHAATWRGKLALAAAGAREQMRGFQWMARRP